MVSSTLCLSFIGFDQKQEWGLLQVQGILVEKSYEIFCKMLVLSWDWDDIIGKGGDMG